MPPPPTPAAPRLLARLAPLLLPATGALVVLFALRQLAGELPALPRLAFLLVCLLAAATYRPAGRGLGGGGAALALACATPGWAAACLLAALGAAAAAILASRAGARGDRGRGSLPEDVALHALAGALAGVAWSLPAATWGRPFAAATTWVAALLLLPFAIDRLRGGASDDEEEEAPGPTALVALVLDAGSWIVGGVLLRVERQDGLTVAGVLLAAGAFALAEAGRQRRLRRRAEEAREALERLGRAGQRLVASPSADGDVALRVHREVRQVLPFSWFRLDLLPPDAEPVTWHATPNGRLREGPPRPPPHPPPLPGLHRRASWQEIERSLGGGGNELARLRLWCDPRRLSSSALTLFEQLVPQLGGLVHRAVLDRQASQDPLTGVALRRVLDNRLGPSFERSRDGGTPLSVVLLDLDFFKKINDRFGHAAGDRALVAVAEVLRAHLRDGDLCARYGGEEFTLLFEGLAGGASLGIVERLRGEIEALQVESDGERLPLTVSAGVACFPEVPCKSGEELLELADAALYEAKRLGRNCCLLHAGRGRFLDGKGRWVETAESDAPQQAPTIFA